MFLILLFNLTIAAYLENIPLTLYQPDGTTVDCFATGDEFYVDLSSKKKNKNYVIVTVLFLVYPMDYLKWQ